MIRDESERKEVGETENTLVKAAACQPLPNKPTAKTTMRLWLCQRHEDVGCGHCMYESKPVCREHRQVDCSECTPASTPPHRCQAMIAICQDCGLHHPVVADACLSQDKPCQMPVVDGIVKGKLVTVLRDTGCSTVVVRRSLIPDEKLTGLEERCILIDGSIRQTPVARIEVDTPYFPGAV